MALMALLFIFPEHLELIMGAAVALAGRREAEPEDDEGKRTGALVLGVVALALAGLSLFADAGPDWYMTGAIGSFGIGLVYYGLTGRNLNSDEPIIPPSSARFRALADPRRPLDAASPVTTDGEAHPSPRSGRP